MLVWSHWSGLRLLSYLYLLECSLYWLVLPVYLPCLFLLSLFFFLLTVLLVPALFFLLILPCLFPLLFFFLLTCLACSRSLSLISAYLPCLFLLFLFLPGKQASLPAASLLGDVPGTLSEWKNGGERLHPSSQLCQLVSECKACFCTAKTAVPGRIWYRCVRVSSSCFPFFCESVVAFFFFVILVFQTR